MTAYLTAEVKTKRELMRRIKECEKISVFDTSAKISPNQTGIVVEVSNGFRKEKAIVSLDGNGYVIGVT